MRILLLSLLLACPLCRAAPAPFPRRAKAMKPAHPGVVFRQGWHVLRVYKTDAEGVYVESASTGYRGWEDGDFMTHEEYQRHLRQCPQTDLEESCNYER